MHSESVLQVLCGDLSPGLVVARGGYYTLRTDLGFALGNI